MARKRSFAAYVVLLKVISKAVESSRCFYYKISRNVYSRFHGHLMGPVKRTADLGQLWRGLASQL